MARTLPNRDACRLSELLSQQPDWSISQRLELFRGLVLQVRELHAEGRTHRAITPQAVSVDGQLRPRLDCPAGRRRFEGPHWDAQQMPPELAGIDRLELPERIEASAALFTERGLALDPRRIDIYQLGALFCHLVTGQTMAAYLYDPKIKSGIPRSARRILQRVVGEADEERLQNCDELLVLLDEMLRDAEAKPVRGAEQ